MVYGMSIIFELCKLLGILQLEVEVIKFDSIRRDLNVTIDQLMKVLSLYIQKWIFELQKLVFYKV
jgi:hypothetical protein